VTSTPGIPIAEPSPTVIMADVWPYAETKPGVNPRIKPGDYFYNCVWKEEDFYRPYAAVKPDPLFPENEQKACVMLSELFIDVEQDEDDVNFLAREIQPLGLSAADVDRLFYYDVFPIVWLWARFLVFFLPAAESRIVFLAQLPAAENSYTRSITPKTVTTKHLQKTVRLAKFVTGKVCDWQSLFLAKAV
jgi:hypothetical protein